MKENNIVTKKMFLLIVTILLTVIPLYNMIIKGVYNWHVRQPEFYQGGLEIIFFSVITYIMIRHKNFHKFLKYVIVLYLSLQGVIIPVLVVYMFFEMIRYIGFTFLKLENFNVGDYITELIMGMIVWGACSIMMSIFNLGTITNLRVGVIVVTISCVALNLKREKTNKYTLLVKKILDYMQKDEDTKIKIILKVIALFFLLMLLGKTNTAIDYDSIWYGLRPEFVLVGDNSFYDYLGYSCFVYYYPKLWELLFLPISGLKDYSFLISANIFIYAFFCSTFYNLSKILIANKKKNLLLLAICICVFSIPAVANISVTAKPDILGAFFTFAGFAYFIKYVKFRSQLDFTMFLSSLMLSTGTKLTYILWAGLLAVSMIVYGIYYIIKNKLKFFDMLRLLVAKVNFKITTFTLIFILGIHYRTLKLTGYPLYPMFLETFNKLKFKALYPFKTQGIAIEVTDININHIITRLSNFVIDPNDLSQVIMLWTSNVLLLLGIAWILSIKKNVNSNNRALFLIIGIPQFMSMLYYMITMPNPDGNYFIFPIIILSFIMALLVSNIETNNYDCKNYIRIILLLVITTNIIITFVSHPSWQIGTRKVDFNIVKDNFETNEQNEQSYVYNGYNDIANYVEEHFSDKRILSSYINLTAIARMQGRLETFMELETTHFSNPAITSSYENFINYLNHANIEGFILLDKDESKVAKYAKRFINENGYTQKIEDEKATFYAIEL